MLLLSCGDAEPQKENSKPIVKTATAEYKDCSSMRQYPFISRPYRESTLSFRVGGQVKMFDAQNGQFFRKGEVIAQLDNRDFLISKQRAEALFEQAEAEYIRIEKLYRKNNISETVFERAKAEYERAKADLNTVSNELEYTRLTAPFDGYVQKTYIERYQDVRPSEPAVTFIDLSRIKVETCIPESMASHINGKGSEKCSISFDGIKDKSFAPSETFMTQSAADDNISYIFTAVIENTVKELLGGMSGYISIESDSTIQDRRVTVPQTAVCHNSQNGTYVWTIDKNNMVSMTPVNIGQLTNGGAIEITSGLKAGDKIAITNLQNLSENLQITAIN